MILPAALGLGLALGSPAVARTWKVPAVVGTVQAGLAAAAPGDTVLLSCGTYREHDLVVGAGVTLRSVTGDPGCAIVDAAAGGRVFVVTGAHPAARIEGLTIRGGKTPAGGSDNLGGGIQCVDSELSLRNCLLTLNSAGLGGGLGAQNSVLDVEFCTFQADSAAHYAWGAGGGMWCKSVSGTLRGCSFAGNTAFGTDPATPGDGGGLFCNRSTLAITDCRFDGNRTGGGAGGFYSFSIDKSVLTGCRFSGNSAAWGGAIYFEQWSQATLSQCAFARNTAQVGGAAEIESLSSPAFSDCDFEGNRATAGSGGAVICWGSWPSFLRCDFLDNACTVGGGAVFLGRQEITFDTCVFAGNTAGANGGAVEVQAGTASLSSCTLAGNAAAVGAGLHCASGAHVSVDHTIIAFAPRGEAVACPDTSACTFSFADLYGNAGGDWIGPISGQASANGDLAADPQFCAAGSNDFRVSDASPCAPRSLPVRLLIGALGVGCAVTALPDREAGPPAAILDAGSFPNPFNPRTRIAFALGVAARAELSIHAVDGRLVRRLLDAELPAGEHEVEWDGRDERGAAAASGVYFFRLQAGTAVLSRKLSLIR